MRARVVTAFERLILDLLCEYRAKILFAAPVSDSQFM